MGAVHLVKGLVATDKKAFYAAEKPLVHEVATVGLIKGEAQGRPEGAADDVICWDNFHQWGADAPGMPMISAPGAFHAAHMHWRWGEVLGTWAGRIAADSWRRFQPGQPLVDPGILRQTILIAVTRYRRTQDPRHTPLRDLTTPRWDDFFHNAADYPTPQPTRNGGDLVLWYSVEVHPGFFPLLNGGTVFLHGMYFPHEAEQGGIAVGSRGSQYWPRSASEIDKAGKWFRPANPQ